MSELNLEVIERWADPTTPKAWTQKMRDEAFLLHAREDIPALVAEVRRLRKERDKWMVAHAQLWARYEDETAF